MKLIAFYKMMHTGSLILLIVQKCLCVSVSTGRPSVYFLLHVGYTLRPSRRRRRRSLSVCPSLRPSHRRRPSSVRSLFVRSRPSVVIRPLSARPSRRPPRRRRPSSVLLAVVKLEFEKQVLGVRSHNMVPCVRTICSGCWCSKRRTCSWVFEKQNRERLFRF